MAPTFALLLSFAVSQTDYAATVRVARGQELVYKGRFSEEIRGHGAPVERSYDLESRVFVLDVNPRGIECALFTVLRPPGSASDAPGSARLELANMDRRGRIVLQSTAASPVTPLEGPPSLEQSAFLELPPVMLSIGTVWDAADRLRPPREWRVVESTFVNGQRCWKILGTQQSSAWDRPTASAVSWRRTDEVWLAAQTGIILRWRRSFERRMGSDGSPGYAATTENELVEDIVYPDKLSAERRREVQQTAFFSQSIAEARSRSARSGVQPLVNLGDRVDQYLAKQPPTPYRPAAIAVKQRIAGELRGESPPADAPEAPITVAKVGDMAPDFLTFDLTTRSPMRLSRLHGKPIALLFAPPDSPNAIASLQLARALQERHGQKLHIAVLVMSNEDRARPAWVQFGVPLYSGRDAAQLFSVGPSVHACVIDADGLIRARTDDLVTVPGAIQALMK